MPYVWINFESTHFLRVETVSQRLVSQWLESGRDAAKFLIRKCSGWPVADIDITYLFATSGDEIEGNLPFPGSTGKQEMEAVPGLVDIQGPARVRLAFSLFGLL